MTTLQKLAHLADPAVFMENRLPAHSDHRHYPAGEFAFGDESPLRELLNGSWKFHWAPNPASCPEGYQRPDFSCAGWDDIAVPMHMELAGYGVPQYVDTRYPWEGKEQVAPHQVPVDYNPTGCYVTAFTIPAAWKGHSVHITFDGVETALHLWCNGRYIGYSEDSYTPAEFDLTSALVEGENKLAVEVSRFCSGSWLEDQDFWRMGGIIRDVFLTAIPHMHIVDIDARAGVDDSYTGGLLDVALRVSGAKRDGAVAWRLLDPSGREAASGAAPLAGDGAAFSAAAPNALLWSAERPHLYTLSLTLLDSAGRGVETVPLRVGFRRVEILDKVLHLNGKRIVLYGVNRHEFSCDKGRAVTRDEMLWDIRFLKQNNFNAVRTSHYPNQTLWYELCDEYGIYLIDETNLETHGTWHNGAGEHTLPGDDPLWGPPVLDRAASMLERDKNHAAVLIWSCGNESWGGKNLYELSGYFRRRDPSRPVHYEGVCHDRRYPDTTDFESRMYTTPTQAAEYLENNPEKPYLLCEYAHAMGNSCGNLFEYTALADRFPQYAGGFIWDYADQTLLYTNPLGERDLAIGGDFGDRPTDYCFCTNGLLYGDRTPSPKVQEVKFLYQPFVIRPGKADVEIRSRLSFSDGSEYTLRWQLLREGLSMAEGTLPFSQPPLSTRRYPLPLPAPTQAGEYTVEVRLELTASAAYAEQGHEAAFGQHTYTVESAGLSASPSLPPEVLRGDCTYTLRGTGFSVQFCNRFGRIGSLRYGGREFIGSPLQTLLPNFWRAPTDNDEGNGHKTRCAVWKTAGMYAEVTSVQCGSPENTAEVVTEYALPGGASCTLRYRVLADGEIEVAESYHGAPGLPEMPCFGISLSIPRTYSQVRYYGLGPDENYIDRCCGAKLGVFHTTAAESLSQYRIPQECGNRTGARWVRLTDDTGRGLMITGAEPFEFSALPFTCHELENAYHHYELPPVTKTVLRLNHRQMGVGGDNAWGARTHDAFLIPSQGEYTFRFRIRPI